MSNIAKALKAEISRIGRKEAKSAISPIARSNIALKKFVADLRGRVTALEKENKRLVAATKKVEAAIPPKPAAETSKARITSTTIRSLRNRLGLSQVGFAKLVGVTPYSVHLWENKDGPLSLRDKTKAAILSVRGLGAKEAKEKLAEAETKSKRIRTSSSKAKKTRSAP